eukprot:GHVR01018090.1.p1 GENE.GHVR01018090.1~~GHVR01018090.1.p1  ORF type:complete len:165 (+),score=8.05 GHVR01018090.1:1213-1707(+)
MVIDANGHEFKKTIIIPIGVVRGNKEKFSIRAGVNNAPKVMYLQHAVELAFALTVWKSQGGSLKYVIVLLEGSPDAPKWRYEHLYVAYSRVPGETRFRCFPLSADFRYHTLASLRPNIWAVKWRMDVREGFWHAMMMNEQHMLYVHLQRDAVFFSQNCLRIVFR